MSPTLAIVAPRLAVTDTFPLFSTRKLISIRTRSFSASRSEVFGDDVGKYQDKFIPAVPGSQSEPRTCIRRRLPHHPQDAIADGMPESVVHLLETVDIQEYDAKRNVVPPEIGQCLGELHAEEAAVGDPGQRVKEGRLLQIFYQRAIAVLLPAFGEDLHCA